MKITTDSPELTAYALGELDEARTSAAAAGTVVSGRLEKVADDPPVYVDVAHNRAGATALAEALPEVQTLPHGWLLFVLIHFGMP